MNKRRKTDLLESAAFAESNPMPDINRAHRDCERECIELRSRVKDIESLLYQASSELLYANNYLEEYSGIRLDGIDELIEEIDAILPATEDKKDEA